MSGPLSNAMTSLSKYVRVDHHCLKVVLMFYLKFALIERKRGLFMERDPPFERDRLSNR